MGQRNAFLRHPISCLFLQYVPVVSRLTICVLEAKDLPKTAKESDKEKEEGEPTIDPMVKVSVKNVKHRMNFMVK